MQNSVELVGIYGNDELIALSAWCSTGRDLTEEKRGRIGKMLKQLAEQGHHTPFEKSTLHFLVTCEMATHVQLLKHRIGVSINGESARYRELKDDKYYLPVDWNEEEIKILELHMEASYREYHAMLERLVARGIDRKRAKESARFFLPYANQLTFDISFNWRSFNHFLSLRNKSDAQLEIQQIAQQMLTLVRETGKFPHTITAFGY